MIKLLADKDFVDYLQKEMYHPRSSAHGDELCKLFLRDLLDICEPFKLAAKNKKLVYKLNYIIDKGSLTQWNIDLVIGPPVSKSQHYLKGYESILMGEPSEIWIAIDAKTIMTEHLKARRNRQRDLNSLHDILHRKDPKTIVGGLLVINMADKFKSPLREGLTSHKNIERIVKGTVELFRGLPLTKKDNAGLDALGIIVISHTNIKGDSTNLIVNDPAPKPSDPLHYMTFLNDICTAFKQRHGSW